MGYISDVTIVCDKKTYEEISRVLNECQMTPDKTWVNKNGHYRLWFHWDKWYYDHAFRIEEIIKGLDEDSDRFAMFLRSGEEFDDIERCEYGNYRLTDNYFPEVVLVVDGFSGTEIQCNPYFSNGHGADYAARVEGVDW